MTNPTEVYILGAGCSVCGGYPLASEVTANLLNFAQKRLAGDEAQELQMLPHRT
jgi:hypothetical protein